MTRYFLIGLLAVAAMFSSLPAQAAGLAKPKLYAVYFHADHCPNCKILGPALASARTKLDKKDILFVTLDLTDGPSIHQSILLASALGIDGYVKQQGSATGYVALLAADKTTEITRFDRRSDAATISKAIEAQLAKAP